MQIKMHNMNLNVIQSEIAFSNSSVVLSDFILEQT